MKRFLPVQNGWGWRVFLLGLLIVFAVVPVGAGQAAGEFPAALQALLPAQAGIAPGWQVFRPNTPLTFSNISQHALQLSPIDPFYPQIVYGGDHLYYAYKDAGGWHTTIVDNAWSVGSGAVLALDSSGKAYISYYDATNKNLKFATNRWGGWQIDVIASTGDVGRYSDIAIDAWGDPAVVYYNFTTAELHFRSYDSEYGDWTNDEVVAAGVAWVGHPGWFSLAMDPHLFKPHVSYYSYIDNTHGTIEWAHYNASSDWVHESVESSCVPAATTCKWGEYNSIALDPATHYPAIAYTYFDAYANDTIWYSNYTGAGWTDDYTVPTVSNPEYVSLGIDVSGYPHLAWNESGLKYSWRNSENTWSSALTLDASANAGQPVSLDVTGTLAKVAYYNPSNGYLSYRDHIRAGWQPSVTIATQGHDVGRCTSLGVDKFGRANISYYDMNNKHLLYARYASGAWTYNTIDSTGNASCYSVMLANPVNGDPTVAYINSGSLYYVVGNGTTWVSPLQVDTGVYSTYDYQAFSMAIDSSGRPHLVYRKGGNVWYAVLNGMAWDKTQIVTGTDASYVALAMGPDNLPWVAFYQSSALNIIHYYLGNWTPPFAIANTGPGNPAGVGVALAVNKNNQPVAAFLNGGGTDLGITRRVCIPGFGCSWTPPAMIDTNVEEYFSLALDPSGTPHLAASALTSEGFRLDYLTQKNGSWSIVGVDTNVGTGWFPSISLAADGTPRISYYDTYNDDLSFILKLNQTHLPLIWK